MARKDKDKQRKQIVIDPKSWAGDEDQQPMPYGYPKKMRDFGEHMGQRAKVILLPVCVLGLLALGYLIVKLSVRYFANQ